MNTPCARSSAVTVGLRPTDSRGRLSRMSLCCSLHLWSGLGDFGEDLALLLFGLFAQVVLGQAIAQNFEAFFRRIYELDQIEIFGGDCACIHEGLEVDDTVPVLAAVDDDQDFLGQLVGLSQ